MRRLEVGNAAVHAREVFRQTRLEGSFAIFDPCALIGDGLLLSFKSLLEAYKEALSAVSEVLSVAMALPMPGSVVSVWVASRRGTKMASTASG